MISDDFKIPTGHYDMLELKEYQGVAQIYQVGAYGSH